MKSEDREPPLRQELMMNSEVWDTPGGEAMTMGGV